ncbi:MAG: rRNA pseudouridine synthase [Pirellulales bacterium]|nr:rRNA pseudouridine synthase [Pirellulales bacterium]
MPSPRDPKKKRPVRKPRRRPPPAARPDSPDARPDRLQKVLAAAGLGSRRQCEELIVTGRVEIDRRVVTELGTRVDPQTQEIRVDGDLLPAMRHVYFAVNKPDGVISTSRDPSGRPRVIDLAPQGNARLFTVGRLDLHSEGLILLTNDGELANRLTHPRYGIQKTYRVMVAGEPTRDMLAQLRRGIRLAEAWVRVPEVKIRSKQKKSTVLEMVLDEGRNREIRRVLAKVGHKVLRLVRVSVGPVRLGNLAPGECRPLGRQEIQALRKAAGM